MLVRKSFAFLSLSLPTIFSPVTTAQWVLVPPRPRTNLTQCKIDILNYVLPYDPFLIASGGQQTTNPLDAIATDYDTCKIYCGDTSDVFNWSLFSPQFQGWLLPFLALMAQLPYESDGTWHDFMSLLLTVGSPLLAMYSLALTILNSRYLKRRLDEAFPGDDIGLKDLKKNIFRTLRLSQQEPFQLGSLDAYPNESEGGTPERDWWHEAQKATSSRKRWFTASLATQAALVIIASSFSWVDAFGSEHMGTNVTAYGLAIALCWSWVAVVVLGWYFAGVSISNIPVSEAIKQANRVHPNSIPRLARFIAPKGLEYFALSRRIAGDVERAGPLYNYAKPFVWTYNMDYLVDTLQKHILGIPTATSSSSASKATVTTAPHAEEDASPAAIPPLTKTEAPNVAPSSEISSHEIAPAPEDVSSYRYYQPKISEKSGWKLPVFQRMLWSAISATVLVVATVGAAFFLDYLTPSTGLGCRSGGILIYWMASYIIWVLMVVSAWVSNHWSVCAATQRIEKGQLPNNLALLGVVAVILRLVGKGLALLNSAWILMHCLFEFTSFYSRCFCATNRGTTPWLWLDGAAIRALDNVQEFWFGLAVLTGAVCAGYISFIGLWTRAHLQ